MEGKSGYFILYSYDGDAVSDYQTTAIVLADTPQNAVKIAKKNNPDGYGFRLDTTRGDAGKLNSLDDYKKRFPNSNLEVFGEGKEVPGKMDIKKEAYVDTNSPAFLELNGYFKELVPSIGKSESVAGELVRAINRLLYRYFNDGDQLGIGYGNETCNPAARYLQRYGSHNVRMLVDNMWDENNTDQYEEYLVELVDEINDMVRDNQYLRNKPTPDMFSFKKPEDDQWGDDDYDEGYGDGSEEDEEEYFDESFKVIDESEISTKNRVKKMLSKIDDLLSRGWVGRVSDIDEYITDAGYEITYASDEMYSFIDPMDQSELTPEIILDINMVTPRTYEVKYKRYEMVNLNN